MISVARVSNREILTFYYKKDKNLLPIFCWLEHTKIYSTFEDLFIINPLV